LGQSGSFALPDEMSAGRLVSPRRGATMAMIVLSSPATLTGTQEKKTGPSRFIADFQNGAVIRILKLGKGLRRIHIHNLDQ